MISAPWPTNQLKRLSRYIRDGTAPPDDLPKYTDVMIWYNDVATEVQTAISGLDWSPLLDDRPIEVTSRPKTLDTLRQKLQRDPGTPLPSVQDVAGVRFEAEMSLDQQDAVAGAIAGLFGHDDRDIKDLRRRPHSGYRAVHVWLRLPARVEVQVRTHLQGAWANGYEAAADVLGRDIRYGYIPQDPIDKLLVEAFQSLSTTELAEFERSRNEKERQLLELRELESREAGSAETPLFSRQVQLRVEAEWAQQRKSELEFLEQLRKIDEQFRSMRGEVR